jgi:hypothetical protein
MPVKAIAWTPKVSRNTVRAALASDEPPKYQRKPAGSAVDAFEPRIRDLLAAYPTLPATVIAERVGWQRGLTVLKDRLRELGPACLPPARPDGPATIPVSWRRTTSGSRRSPSRPGSGRNAGRRSCQC